MIAAVTEYNDERQARFEGGMVLLNKVCEGRGQAFVDSLADVSPELARHVAERGFGEILARPHLARRDWQLFTLGVLTGLGGTEDELRLHINIALNVGVEPLEIVEALLQSAGYCGVRRAIDATKVAREILAERNLEV